MNWEIGIDIYTLICIKWITNKNVYKKIDKIKFKNSKKKKRFSEYSSSPSQWLTSVPFTFIHSSAGMGCGFRN